MYEQIIILFCFIILLFVYASYKDVVRESILALIMSSAWVSLSGLYNYKTMNITIGNANLIPIIWWTVGLVVLKEIYDNIKIKKAYKIYRVFLIYSVLLIFIEYIGYNLFKIQLDSQYSGLFGLPIMHMPWWGQLYYFAAAPIYLGLCKLFKIK